MNLDNLIVPSAQSSETTEQIPAEQEFDGCSICEVEGSQRLPNGTCDVCGAAWVDDETDEDDITQALELITCVWEFLDDLCKSKHTIRCLSMKHERMARDLAQATSDYLNEWNWDRE